MASVIVFVWEGLLSCSFTSIKLISYCIIAGKGISICSLFEERGPGDPVVRKTVDGRIKFSVQIKSELFIVKMDSGMMHYGV